MGLRLRLRVSVRLELYLEVGQIAATHLHGWMEARVARRTVHAACTLWLLYILAAVHSGCPRAASQMDGQSR